MNVLSLSALRRLSNDDLDTAIGAASEAQDFGRLEDLLGESEHRCRVQRERLEAIDALWTEHGVDCDAIRTEGGTLVWIAGGFHHHIIPLVDDSERAFVISRRRLSVGRSSRRFWTRGDVDVTAATPEALALLAISAGWAVAPI